MPLILESASGVPVSRRRVEAVERKGIGHPDSICDAVVEEVSQALCREYLGKFGRVLHHNVDKGLLVAGRTSPRLRGGEVLEPMRLVLGDRATFELRGIGMDVRGVCEIAVRNWFKAHLPRLSMERDLILQNELKPGSPELADIFERAVLTANDSSAAVGHAPLTETEALVLETERFLNSGDFKRRFPEAGEDVKVMGYRKDRILEITAAVAFVDGFVPSAAAYYSRKEEMRQEIESFLNGRLRGLDRVFACLNALDDPERGEAGMYLTVLGTSAEGADCGAVGRGNSVNGVISLHRPRGAEAAAGKNPVSHVGKIYTLLAHYLAAEIHREIPGIEEVTVWLGSRIGGRIDDPALASVEIAMQPGFDVEDAKSAARNIFEREMNRMDEFTGRLIRGEFAVC